MTRVLGVVGSPTAPSKTRAAVELALDAAAGTGTVETAAGTETAETADDTSECIETDVLHLAEYDLDTADGRGIDAYEGDTAAALGRIVEADAYVVGTPVYRGSLSGSLKNLLDMVPRGKWQGDVAPFEDAAVGLVATGATDHHYLAVDQELRPVFGFFGAHTVGGSVYASDAAFDDEKRVVDDTTHDRLATLGAATVELSRALDDADALTSLGPQM